MIEPSRGWGYRWAVSSANYREATLVVVGHGATDNCESVAPVYRHAAALRARGIFGQVLECFWMVEPRVGEIWQRIQCGTVYVVPVSISEGHFTNTVIPTALGIGVSPQTAITGPHRLHGRMVHYCEPIGMHSSMTEVVLARARDVVRANPAVPAPSPDTTTLIIAGHGTERDDRSRLAIEDQVELVRQRRLFAAVAPAFMIESPLIRDCWTAAATPDLVMVPFFISDGPHTAQDIPVLLGEPEAVVLDRLARKEPGWINPTSRAGRRLWYASAIGSEPGIADVILQRVEGAKGGP